MLRVFFQAGTAVCNICICSHHRADRKYRIYNSVKSTNNLVFHLLPPGDVESWHFLQSQHWGI